MRRRQPRPRQRVLPQRLGRLADLPLAGQEDEDVAAPSRASFVGGVDDGVVEVALVILLFQIRDRPVTHLDRIEPAGNLDHRAAPCEMLRKALGVDGRRGDDQLQVRPPGQQLLQVAEQKIDVQAALMRLVDDDRLVGVQVGVGLRFGEQDAVGHQLDPAVRGRLVVEADFHADPGADLRLQLLRQPRRHRARRQPARLGVADQAARADAEVEADLRQLRRLARAGLAADDHHLVLRDQLGDVGAPLVDRQVRLEIRFRQLAAPLGHGGTRPGQQFVQLGLQFLPLFAG